VERDRQLRKKWSRRNKAARRRCRRIDRHWKSGAVRATTSFSSGEGGAAETPARPARIVEVQSHKKADSGDAWTQGACTTAWSIRRCRSTLGIK